MKFKNILGLLFSVICFAISAYHFVNVLDGFPVLLESVDLEAGSKTVSLSQFYKEGRVSNNSEFLTDINTINLDTVGSYAVKILDNNKEKVVQLNVVDTTPPTVEFKDISRGFNYEINAEDFVESVSDYSDIIVEIKNAPEISDGGEYKVLVAVKDEYDNVTEKECTLNVTIMVNEFTLELGKKLQKKDIILDERFYDYLSDSEINRINKAGVGEYKIEVKKDENVFSCKIKIQDTTPPVIKLKSVTITEGQKISGKEAFIKSVTDASKIKSIEMKTNIDLNKIGTQTIVIEAIDAVGNKATAETKLTINKDKNPPVFSGLSDIKIDKNTTIDYNKGVTATDKKDGKVSFTVDSSKVNVAKYGTYYATYTAKDSDGNSTIKKRKITVNYDENDVAALVATHYAKIGSSDYKAIRNYVKTKIGYKGDLWYKADPVWFGLNNLKGNCYVHAYIYKAFLDKAGYQNKIIYTTDQTHYWNLILINGVWRHSDSTPGGNHGMIVAETDEVRYAHLQGRDWDRSKWPAAL